MPPKTSQATTSRKRQAAADRTNAKRPRLSKNEPHTTKTDDLNNAVTEKKADSKATAAKSKSKPAAVRPHDKSRASLDVLPIINAIPERILTVLVFGTGDSSGELGLGPEVKEAKRATVIPSLDCREAKPDRYRIVQLDCGGMHTVALTDDGKVVTWGCNDKGALGRPTAWEGGLRDIDDAKDDGSDSEDSDEQSMNPLESTPTHIPEASFPPGTKITAVAAGDSCSFAVTSTGLVYGWGTFVNAEGKDCFLCYPKGQKEERIKAHEKPMLIPGLQNIKSIACGSNHALALDSSGRVWTWGVNEKGQVGRRTSPRPRAQHHFMHDFYPGVLDLSRHGVKSIAAGEFHSFAVDNKDRVFAWGANNFGQTGYAQNAGLGNAVLPYPMQIHSLSKHGVTMLSAASHHSAAVTADGRFLVWGRIDGGHLGLNLSQEQVGDPKLVRRDEFGKPRILLKPLAVPNIGDAIYVACSTGHTLFINSEGKAFAAGFGFQYQLGNGTTEDAQVAEEVKAKALKNVELTWCGTAGQYSMVAAPVAETSVSYQG